MSVSSSIDAIDGAFRSGRLEDALAGCDALIAQGNATQWVFLTRGAALYGLQRLEEAETAFAESVRRWPLEPSTHEALANLRWMRGDREGFARDFVAAVRANPSSLALRIACSTMLCKADLYPQAEALLRDALVADPTNVSLLLSLGAVMDESGRQLEGAELLERAWALAPRSMSVRANLALSFLRLGRSEAALALILPARAMEPLVGSWIAYESMALRQLGDPRYHDLCDYELMVQSYELPTPPGFSGAIAFNAELRDRLNALHGMNAHPLGQSLRGGSQANRSLLTIDDPVIKAYLAALNEPIRAYTNLMRNPDHPWSGRKTGAHRLSGCWSAKLRPGGYHVNHIHPQGWISSAYYVALPEVVTCGDTQEGWIKFGEPRWSAPGCEIEKVVQPQIGRLVLFPSYMWHGTIPFSDGERLTAPFDVVPA